MSIIAEKLLQYQLKKVKRRVGVVNLKTAKTALIIYDATIAENEKTIRTFARFLKEEGIKTTTIGFYKLKGKEDVKPEDELTYHYFDKKSFNWLGFPTDERLKGVISTDFNLLLDFNVNNRFQLEVISTLSRANFKVGKSGGYQNEICDLTLATEKKDLKYLIEQTKVYLNMINK